MKPGWIAAFGVIASLHAQQPGGAPVHHVTVYVTGREYVPPTIRFMAEGVAARLLRQAGIQVTWRAEAPGRDNPADWAIHLEYRSDCGERKGTAAAFAWPHEGTRAVVLYDQLRWAEPYPSLSLQLLGHVLAHEIAHDLQGVPHHATSGIMKTSWTARDYEEMTFRGLSFEAQDVELIRKGLQSRLASAPSAETTGSERATR